MKMRGLYIFIISLAILIVLTILKFPCFAKDIIEDFSQGFGGFGCPGYDWGYDGSKSEPALIENGRLIVDVRGEYDYYFAAWIDCSDSDSYTYYPAYGTSDYFDNFSTSIDLYWLDGDANRYGVYVCLQGNYEKLDNIWFVLWGDQYYRIYKSVDWTPVDIVPWTTSNFIKRKGEKNTLRITKQNSLFSFYINGSLVCSQQIPGYSGGGIGITYGDSVKVGFDNFVISTGVSDHTIKANAALYGAISPSGTIAVEHGGNQTFTITPESGYKISDVFVDHHSQGAINTYTFTNVIGDHTISASFVLNEIEVIDTGFRPSINGFPVKNGKFYESVLHSVPGLSSANWTETGSCMAMSVIAQISFRLGVPAEGLAKFLEENSIASAVIYSYMPNALTDIFQWRGNLIALADDVFSSNSDLGVLLDAYHEVESGVPSVIAGYYDFSETEKNEGHAVVAYRVTYLPEKDVFRFYVYDPNSQLDDMCYLSYEVTTGKLSHSGYKNVNRLVAVVPYQTWDYVFPLLNSEIEK